MADIDFGLWITAVGMGTVFVMLLLLMVLLQGIGRLDGRRRRRPADARPEPVGNPDEGRSATDQAHPGELSPELVAAITIAVITHVRVRRGQAAPAMRQVQPGSHLFASRWVAVGRSYQNKPWK
ncbi:MAG: OadG family transporter subunit [Propionicimonas sp.]|uniref:OadG family transporter subunit n=1 Tax=Propionicimonas sp. TaxID=1955623 RepID=UPI002B20326A|nr:OadG family transporter subunit [Propionicimonas sp.]MEA4944615.1 OadG family transporter subunit [Propionicimonas sp.]MEA5117466.1 OadG family transporter subunit [Propionicimonas sp.]